MQNHTSVHLLMIQPSVLCTIFQQKSVRIVFNILAFLKQVKKI